MNFDPAAEESPWTFDGTLDGAQLAVQLNSLVTQYDEGLNCLWMMVSAVLVFWMQGGFAMLEVGTVRAKNAQNILLKNLLDITVGAVVWWAIGYGFSAGTSINGFIGSSYFFGSGFEENPEQYRTWFFGWTFAATAATIVSGALAERTKFEGYALFSMAMTAFIYPVAVHWAWGGGFLSEWGFLDFAGSGVVHALAGVSALTGAAMVGPRSRRFEPGNADEFKPHNMPLVMIGTVILWMGWYGFNAGTTGAMNRSSVAYSSAKIAMVTTIAASFGGLTAFLVRYFISRVYDVGAMCNGVLAGLVGITAICDVVEPFPAAFCGAGGGLALIFASSAVQGMGIDDPLDAFSVHGAAGIWGVVAVGLFHNTSGLFSGGGATLLGIQVMGIVILLTWSGLCSALVFTLLKTVGLLRVSQETEDAGLDIHEHGGAAYKFSTVWKGSVIGMGGFVGNAADGKATELTATS